MMQERVRVGAAQCAPKFLDKAGTLEKTCRIIAEAGTLGVDLLVFPETFFGGYPYWRGSVSVRRSTELATALQKNAIRVDGEEAQALAAAARRARVNCVIGANELSDRPGSLTVYNSLFFIGREGQVLGRHRKLMPTHSERVYWGMGDASDIRVFDMDVGRVGGIICYEHHMTLLKAAMALKGEEIHCAVWPGWWELGRHLGDKTPKPGSPVCDIEPAIREYALETQTFVVSSSWYLPPGEIPEALRDVMQYNLAVGGSCIVNPAGVILAGPVFNEERIVWADIDLEERRLVKAYFDAAGHYARFDLLNLVIREETWTPFGPRPIPSAADREASAAREEASSVDARLARLERAIADLAARGDRPR